VRAFIGSSLGCRAASSERRDGWPGFFFITGLRLLERDEGTLLALAVSPLTPGRPLVVARVLRDVGAWRDLHGHGCLNLALCGVTNLVAGGTLGRTVSGFVGPPWRRRLAAAAVGGLLATLGGLALGIGSAVGAASGLMVGAAAGALLPHRAVA
jgi:hypothetical protein